MIHYNPVFSEELQTKIFKIKHSSGRSLYSVVENIKSNEGKVSFDPNTNTLIVVDKLVYIEQIAKIIEELDMPQRQVEIEATVAEVGAEFIKSAGVKAGQIIIPKAEFSTIVNLLNTKKDSRITSKSTIKTLSNHPARIALTEDKVIGEERVIFSSGTTITTPLRKAVGSVLEVLPTVNNDNTITLAIRPHLSTVSGDLLMPFERSLATEVIINNNDTIVIAGADAQTEEKEIQNIFGIPLSMTGTQESKKTVIFLTARIID